MGKLGIELIVTTNKLQVTIICVSSYEIQVTVTIT